MPLDPSSGVYYELDGTGPALVIGLPLFASMAQILGEEAGDVRRQFLDGLTADYRVLTIDYPSIGRSRDIAPEELSADRVCADIIGVADHAGFERFAFLGYSWSGAVGLQLAARTDRLSALLVGGWPPLHAPYREIWAAVRDRIGHVEPGALRVLRSADQYRQWDSFYASIEDWDEEADVTRISCPRMVFFGGDGDLVEAGHSVPIASTIRGSRERLERLGWRVEEISGQGHSVGMMPELILPPIRDFLDGAQLR